MVVAFAEGIRLPRWTTTMRSVYLIFISIRNALLGLQRAAKRQQSARCHLVIKGDRDVTQWDGLVLPPLPIYGCYIKNTSIIARWSSVCTYLAASSAPLKNRMFSFLVVAKLGSLMIAHLPIGTLFSR